VLTDARAEGMAEVERRAAAVKDELRRATDAAWHDGVRGVPTFKVGDRLFYGDDELNSAHGYADAIGER
jgi:2-hydroxychromene-2-carboxylate isomerase